MVLRRRRPALVAAALCCALVPAAQASAKSAPPLQRGYEGPGAAPDPRTPEVEPEPAPPPPEPEGPVDADGDGVLDIDEEPTEDEGFDGFEIVDLTEDEEALEKELAVESKEVKGDSGTIKGTVRDGVTGDPIIAAYVEAVGTEYRTKTGPNGEYTLELPPGTYKIRIRTDESQPRQFDAVAVAANESQDLSTDLEPLEGAGQTVVVEAEMNKESAGARLLQRKEATETRDIMSRDEIAKSGGGSTSNVAKKIVGVSLVGGRFIFVRGLGHRYGNTFFDRARVPSPEPELRTVPLDIFPTAALSAINVQKTFTPDIPADFAGGSVQLESREVPDELVFELGAEIGANTATTFRDYVTNGGFGAYDAFGFGNIPRGLPSEIPRDMRAGRGVRDENFEPVYTDEQIAAQGRAMYTDTKVRPRDLAPPNFGFKATLGYGTDLKNEGKIGFLLAAAYKNELQTRRDWLLRQYTVTREGGEPVLQTGTPRVDYRGTQTTNTVAWNTVGLLQYDVNKNNRLELLGFYSREAEDETRAFEGFARNVSGAERVRATRLRYIMRSIMLSRLGGSHEIPEANGLIVDWFGSFSQAKRDDPAIRGMTFVDAGGRGEFVVATGNNTGQQQFLDLNDYTESGSLNFTLPFKQWKQLGAKVKTGFWAEGKQREFVSRRFTFLVANGLNDVVPTGTGNVINDSTIGSGLSAGAGGTRPFYLQEQTQPTDSYEANQEIYAGYGLVELPFVRWFKVAGGVRFEGSNIFVNSFDPFDQSDNPFSQPTTVVDRDFLPSVSLIFSPTDKQNVRISGTRTLARPEFRELAPFEFTDFVGGGGVLGNPDLVSTKIWNADLRWEWFPSAREVVAASLFYKHFDEPIERIVRPDGSVQDTTFRNADAANSVGVEFEGRKNLEFIWKKLSDVSVGLSVAYIYSRVVLRPSCDPAMMECDNQDLDVSTSRERPMQDQSPYDINAYLSYDNDDIGTSARIVYDVEGPRIDAVGGLGLPDIYFMPYHDLNFVFSQRLPRGWTLNAAIENIANSEIRFEQSDAVYERFRIGTTFILGLEYKI